MEAYSIHYHFSQRFDFAAEEAYEWCVSFDAGDVVRMGKRGSRRIKWIDDDTLILTDTVLPQGGRGKGTTKRRLVRLYPERLTWTNTRLSPVGRYSQFLYEIISEGATACRLEFTGSHIEHLKGGAWVKRQNKKKKGAEGRQTAKETAHGSAEEAAIAARIASRAAELTEADAGAWKLLAQEMEKDLRV
jgi:hypothetical protein